MAAKRSGGKSGGGDERLATEDEKALWHSVVRDARPLRPGDRKPSTKKPVRAHARGDRQISPPTTAVPGAVPGPGLDKRSAQRLKRGRRAIDGRLDLHGMTLDEAHAALDGFLERAERAGKRCLLVITGKGGRAAATGWDADAEAGAGAELRPRGVLRDAVPRWLQVGANRRRVLAVEPARPQHGGDGALYVLLRRKRT